MRSWKPLDVAQLIERSTEPRCFGIRVRFGKAKDAGQYPPSETQLFTAGAGPAPLPHPLLELSKFETDAVTPAPGGNQSRHYKGTCRPPDIPENDRIPAKFRQKGIC